MLSSMIALVIFISSLVGLGTGQTAKIILTYPPTVGLLDGTNPPSTCKVEVGFLDANSKLVKSQFVLLVPGQSAQVTLSRSELGVPPSAIHPLFWVGAGLVDNCNGDPSCDVTLCNIRATAEEADSSGSTDLLLRNQGLRARFVATN